jgi:predicted helicase
MQLTRRDAITDAGLYHFQSAYPQVKISKEDVFYYVYGLLHAPDYRASYANNLGKELPRIPRVARVEDFWAFSHAGRALAELHINYDQATMYPALVNGLPYAQACSTLRAEDFYVTKMSYGKQGKDKDLTLVHYNAQIIITQLPLAAYEYVVNGKAAIDWVVERQGVRTDKDSGIVNDANAYATETMHNPRYPLELLLRVITVSLETLKIVRELPGL